MSVYLWILSMKSQPSTTSKTKTVFISLGANQPSSVGSEQETIRAAVSRLESLSEESVLVSNLYVSDPVDCLPGTEDFVNAVAKLQVSESLSPHQLLEKLHQIENSFGRRRGALPNLPRPLDLDLICFGETCLQTETLVLPHPRASERLFVLVPLGELCSRAELGEDSSDIAELIQRLPKSPGLRKL